jgi:hypothetical protein
MTLPGAIAGKPGRCLAVTGFRRYEDHVLDRDRVVIDQKGGPPALTRIADLTSLFSEIQRRMIRHCCAQMRLE